MPKSTDLGLREMDVMEQKLNDEVVITKVIYLETINSHQQFNGSYNQHWNQKETGAFKQI
jgi:hypothetical protein